MPDVKDIQTATAQEAPAAQETVQTAVPAQETPNPSPRPTMKRSGGKGRKKMIKRLVALAVIAAIVGGAGFGMWYLVFREDKGVRKPLTDMAGINTIQSVVQGYGTAVPKESAAITLNAAGTVDEVYVTVGQTVFAGQELYTIDSQAARDNLQKAQDEMNKLLEEANNLTVRAPFAGKLISVSDDWSSSPTTR